MSSICGNIYGKSMDGGQLHFTWVYLVMNCAVISRLRHGIFGYYGHAEMPAAGYPGIHDRCQNCEGGVFRDTFVLRN